VVFYSAEEELDVGIRRADGTDTLVSIDKPIDRHLGVELVPDKIRLCKANCDFCFVLQQPKKLRRALYIKDDDYRLSFLHGNFITLTNMTPADYTRVFEQRLSPLYISVHATDDEIRRRHLQAPQARPIMDELRLLLDNGIDLHTQNVIVPGMNDGRVLDNTLRDLAGLYPGVLSIGVVPVGLTKHRKHRAEVLPNTPEHCRDVLRQVDRARQEFVAAHDDPLVYAADEFFLQGGEPIPPAEYYLDFVQLENGVGLVRRFIDGFDEEFDRLPESLAPPREVTLVTGRSAEPFICTLAARVTERVANLDVGVLAVDNEFWGATVTISGLLTGQDISAALLKAKPNGSDVLLPPDCLNTDGLFLDDQTPENVASATGYRVHTSSYSLVDSVLSALSAA